jgi:molybdopterin-guanine dinucleotide biosynthesis protein A
MGGKSSRMKEDKSLIVYHKKAQFHHIFELLSCFCDEVYLSTNQEINHFKCIKDSIEFGNIGPINGVLTALKTFKSLILVMAIDYPLFSEDEIKNLLDNRDKSSLASVIFNPESNFFEPFLGIYEFSFYEKILEEVRNEKYSLQAILHENNVKKVYPLSRNSLLNCNTLEEKNHLIQLINEGN